MTSFFLRRDGRKLFKSKSACAAPRQMVNPLSAGGCRILTRRTFRINHGKTYRKTDLAYRPE